jgi:hypothetical protein
MARDAGRDAAPGEGKGAADARQLVIGDSFQVIVREGGAGWVGDGDRPAGDGSVGDDASGFDDGAPADASDDGAASAPDQGCIPQCAGKACGAPDACGDICRTGSCPTGQLCSAGRCLCTPESCPNGCCSAGETCEQGTADYACGSGGRRCDDCQSAVQQCHQKVCRNCEYWRVALPALTRSVDVDLDGSVFVAGQQRNRAYLAAVDSCGQSLRQASFGRNGSSLTAAASLEVFSRNVYLAGHHVPTSGDPQQGLLLRIDKSSFQMTADRSLTGNADKDEVWDIALAGSALWMSGTAAFDTSARVWGVISTLSTDPACGFTLLPESGNGRKLHVPEGGNYVYFTGAAAGKGFVARHGNGDCAIAPCDLCPASWSTSFQDGDRYTEGRDLLLENGELYVAGFSRIDGGDTRAMVFRLDLATGQVQGSHAWNPTNRADMFFGIATDGQAIYVAGVRNYDGAFGTATRPVVQKLSLPSLQLQWTRTPETAGAYRDLAVLPDGGLLLVGYSVSSAGAEQGYLRRCSTSGRCP